MILIAIDQSHTINRILPALIADRRNEYLMLDTTLVRAHQQAATGKGARATRLWGVPEED